MVDRCPLCGAVNYLTEPCGCSGKPETPTGQSDQDEASERADEEQCGKGPISGTSASLDNGDNQGPSTSHRTWKVVSAILAMFGTIGGGMGLVAFFDVRNRNTTLDEREAIRLVGEAWVHLRGEDSQSPLSLSEEPRDILKAEYFVRQADKTDPDAIEVQLVKGFLLLKKKRWDEARKCFERVLEDSPDRMKAHYGLFASYNHGNGWLSDESRSALNKAIETASDPSYFLVRLGRDFELTWRHEEALRLYERAKTLRDDYASSWARIGEVCLHLASRASQESKEDLLSKAEHHFEVAIARGSEDPYVYYHLGRLLFDRGDYAQAKTKYDLAVSHSADDRAWFTFVRGVYYQRLARLIQVGEVSGDYDETLSLALEAYESAAAIEVAKKLPIDFQLLKYYLQAGRLHAIREDYASAREAYSRAYARRASASDDWTELHLEYAGVLFSIADTHKEDDKLAYQQVAIQKAVSVLESGLELPSLRDSEKTELRELLEQLRAYPISG